MKKGITIVFFSGLLAVVQLASAPVLNAADAPAVQETKNPFAGKPEMVKEGEKIFDANCTDCHGGDAMGGSGPDLTDDKWIYGGSDEAVYETVSRGRKGGMPAWRSQLTKDDIWKAIAYIRSLSKK